MKTTVDKFKKRGAIMAMVLLVGVSFAGVVSAFIETPQGQNDFLHEHLEAVSLQAILNWKALEFDLPTQDKDKISKIISQAENPLAAKDLGQGLTGQALEKAQADMCVPDAPICNFHLRVNRQLSAVHLNKDMRVVNVEEKSRRVTLQLNAAIPGIELKGLADEERVLSFYQTQTGWVQNSSASLKITPPSFESRKGQFREKFSKDFIGLNYYPASASWADFWNVFPKDEVEADLEKAKALNVDALRIFLTHNYFDAEDMREEALFKLEALLDMCEAKGLSVLVTLFDLRPDYTLSNWEADIIHIDRVLSRIAAHKAVLGIDLKNQADLDFAHWGQGRVEAWLTVMARHIQTHYSHFPVTTGWSKAENAVHLNEVFDFVTYHEYENPKGLDTRLREVRAAIGNKPVMITELGSTIWHPPFIKSVGESKQAVRLHRQLQQAGQANGVFVWTLNDFEHVSRDVVGPLPWRRVQQKHFGLIRGDGSLRPAADILKSFGEQSQRPAENPILDSPHIPPSPL
ncbi:MAG: hypothetical protein ABJG88_09875 [Litorimonas sp.]